MHAVAVRSISVVFGRGGRPGFLQGTPPKGPGNRVISFYDPLTWIRERKMKLVAKRGYLVNGTVDLEA